MVLLTVPLSLKATRRAVNLAYPLLLGIHWVVKMGLLIMLDFEKDTEMAYQTN